MNHPRRRQRHEAAPDDPGDQQAAATGLRQADDLLPAEHFDAGGDPQDPDHLNSQGSFSFQDILSDGSAWGIELSYAEQLTSDGVPQAFLIGEAFLGSASTALILGDNLFYGNDITASMRRAASSDSGAMLFAYRFVDLERYGVANYEVDAQGRARGTSH